MRIKRLLLIIGLCTLAPGCCPLIDVARSTIIEPVHYCNSLELVLECARNRALADAAWEEVERTKSDGAYSGDYAAGFHEGFTDYLFAGGSGEPPPVPPRRYWKIYYQTPRGYQAAQEWFAGFRHGAGVAKQSAYRRFLVVPSSLAGPNPPKGQVVPPFPYAAPAGQATGAAEEPVLPAPRKIMPSIPPDTEPLGVPLLSPPG
jgi:hypothetical protein